MPRLTRRARIELLVLLALALGSCGQGTPRTFTEADYGKLDAASANGRNAVQRVYELEQRVDRLEAMVRDLRTDARKPVAVAPAPMQYELMGAGRERRLYPTAARCEAARHAMQEARERERARGVIAISELTCIPV